MESVPFSIWNYANPNKSFQNTPQGTHSLCAPFISSLDDVWFCLINGIFTECSSNKPFGHTISHCLFLLELVSIAFVQYSMLTNCSHQFRTVFRLSICWQLQISAYHLRMNYERRVSGSHANVFPTNGFRAIFCIHLPFWTSRLNRKTTKNAFAPCQFKLFWTIVAVQNTLDSELNLNYPASFYLEHR